MCKIVLPPLNERELLVERMKRVFLSSAFVFLLANVHDIVDIVTRISSAISPFLSV